MSVMSEVRICRITAAQGSTRMQLATDSQRTVHASMCPEASVAWSSRAFGGKNPLRSDMEIGFTNSRYGYGEVRL